MPSSNLTIVIDEYLIQDIMDLTQFIAYETKLNELNNADGYGLRLAKLYDLVEKHENKYKLAEKIFYIIQEKYKQVINE